MRKSVLALLALAAAPLFAQDAEQWELTSARVEVRLNLELLAGMGVRIAPLRRRMEAATLSHALAADGRLVADAPRSIFRTVVGGELRLSGGPVLQSKNATLTFEGATIRPTGAEPSTYVISAADGSPLFVADHQHVRIDRVARTARFYNLGLRLTRELASRLGHPLLADVGIGVLEINATAGIPDRRGRAAGWCVHHAQLGQPAQRRRPHQRQRPPAVRQCGRDLRGRAVGHAQERRHHRRALDRDVLPAEPDRTSSSLPTASPSIPSWCGTCTA